jgi:dUTP pyrophosphatase
LAFEIPEGFEGQVRPRSGLSFNSGTLTSFGTIDADYRGEIKICLYNHSFQTVRIKSGDRVAQLVIAPVVQAQLTVVSELSGTVRGQKGFGSSGK